MGRVRIKEKFSQMMNELNEKGKLLSSTSLALIALTRMDELLKLFEESGSYPARLITSYLRNVISSRRSATLVHNVIRKLLLSMIEYISEREGRLNMPDLTKYMREKIVKLRREIITSLQALSIIASKRIERGDSIMTNAFSLSVLFAIRRAVRDGKDIKVYIAESRPFSNGIQMAETLDNLGIEVVLFVDSAIRYFMKEVDKVFIGAESIAANGALVGKVGTSILALTAHEARVRVLAISSILKFSPETFFGELIEEERASPEFMFSQSVINELKSINVSIYVPVLDFTPSDYIDLIVTEKGVIAPQAVPFIIKEIYGWPPRAPDVNELLTRFEHEIWRLS
ncbi:MAG: initiation factor 2B [Thermoprotei archaeon]|nr:MAG: initiation factor 2B [Thermoprotei archaeon]